MQESYNSNFASANGFGKTQLLKQSENTNPNGFPPVIWDANVRYHFKKVTTQVMTKTVLQRKLFADGTIRKVKVTVDKYWEVTALYVESRVLCHKPKTLTVSRRQAYLMARIPEPTRQCRFL